MSELKHYRRLWILVTVVTVLLIALTVTLNVMHAPANWGARLVGGTPPVFVFFCIELISRIPATSKWLSFGRIFASIIVSGLAFAISYEQQREFITGLGFKGWVAQVYPVIIDGVVVVATLSLVEITRKVRSLKQGLEAATAVTVPAMPGVAWDPTLHLEDEATKAYREAQARMRAEAKAARLNGHRTPTVAAVN